MAALRSRSRHYIFAPWFRLLSSFTFFLAYCQPSQIGCLPYFHTWCGGLSANLGCRCETCCRRLAENTGCKKSPKIRHLRTIAQLCRAISSQLRYVSTFGKKLLNSNIPPHALQYGNFGLGAAEIVSLVWGTQQISTGFASWQRYCTAHQQWASAKLCGVEQGRHLYSAGRPSRWALAHIQVFVCNFVNMNGL